MSRDEIATFVKRLISSHFNKRDHELNEDLHLWDDLEADDLDFIEISYVLEDNFTFSDFDCIDLEYYRRSTVRDLIDTIHDMLNPI